MVNLVIKFEVSTFTNYEDTKSDANIDIKMVWEIMVPKVIANIAIRYRAREFLLDFNRNYASLVPLSSCSKLVVKYCRF